MTNAERIAKITELGGEDLKFDLDQLRTKELDIVLKGLDYDAKMQELTDQIRTQADDITELNASLAEAESAPRAKNAAVPVGKVGNVAYEMTVPQARIHEEGYPKRIFTRAEIKADAKLLALLVKRGVSYLRKRA